MTGNRQSFQPMPEAMRREFVRSSAVLFYRVRCCLRPPSPHGWCRHVHRASNPRRRPRPRKKEGRPVGHRQDDRQPRRAVVRSGTETESRVGRESQVGSDSPCTARAKSYSTGAIDWTSHGPFRWCFVRNVRANGRLFGAVIASGVAGRSPNACVTETSSATSIRKTRQRDGARRALPAERPPRAPA